MQPIQNLYLQAMGIQVWQPRNKVINTQAVENQLKIIVLLNQQEEKVAYLGVAVAPDGLPPDVLALLDAMLRAISLQRGVAATAYTDDLATLPPKPLLLMGEKLAQYFLRTPKQLVDLRGYSHYSRNYPQFTTLVTFTAAEVLADPRLKRLAWADLRCFQHYVCLWHC